MIVPCRQLCWRSIDVGVLMPTSFLGKMLYVAHHGSMERLWYYCLHSLLDGNGMFRLYFTVAVVTVVLILTH